MITINYVLKEKKYCICTWKYCLKIELMNENVYAMSDIGHKNVCREYYYVLDEVKRIMKYWKKHSIIAFDSEKKTRVKEKINCPPKITNWPVDISKKKMQKS